MASNSQAALLDQLMGIDRNSTRKREITWDDERICRYYLAGFCPHELFVNTRMSLGSCTKIHDTNLLSKYKDSSSYLKVGYERKLQRFLQSFVRDIESKIKYNEEKLLDGFKSGTLITIQNRIQTQEEEITKLVNEIEKLGNEGKIGECQYLHTQLEEKQKQFKYDKIELERQKIDSQDFQDVVCKICGAYTSKNDLKNSVENHISGKIHSGYVKINEILEDLASLLDDANESIKEEKERSPNRYAKDDRSYDKRRARESSNRNTNEYRQRDRSHHKRDKHHSRSHREDREKNKTNSRHHHSKSSPGSTRHKIKEKQRKTSERRKSRS